MRSSSVSLVMPALLIKISTRSWSFKICSHAALTAALSATSTAYAWARPPAATMAAATAPHDSAFFDTHRTLTPCAASFSAIALPMPRPAPVTSAVRLVNVKRLMGKETGNRSQETGARRNGLGLRDNFPVEGRPPCRPF